MSDSVTVSVLAPPADHGGIGKYAEQLRTRVAEMNDVEGKFIPLYEESRAVGQLKAAISAPKSDVVHIHFEYGLFRPKLSYAWLFLPVLFIITQLKNTPVIVTVHEVWTSETIGEIQYVYVWMVHALLAFITSRLIFMTEDAADDFRPQIHTEIDCIPHGVDIDSTKDMNRTEARRTFGYEEEDIVISQIGYVSPRKGTETFLSLAQRHPEYEFLLAGGPLREEDTTYFEQINENAPGNVRVTGVLSDESFHAAFIATDVAILAYHDIRQSGILNWCFAYKVPAVCRGIDRFKQLRERGAPLVLFNQRGRSIDQALHEALDSATCRGEKMHSFGEEQSLSVVANNYADLYRSCS